MGIEVTFSFSGIPTYSWVDENKDKVSVTPEYTDDFRYIIGFVEKTSDRDTYHYVFGSANEFELMSVVGGVMRITRGIAVEYNGSVGELYKVSETFHVFVERREDGKITRLIETEKTFTGEEMQVVHWGCDESYSYSYGKSLRYTLKETI